MPRIPASWKANSRELQIQGHPAQLNETLTQNKKYKELEIQISS